MIEAIKIATRIVNDRKSVSFAPSEQEQREYILARALLDMHTTLHEKDNLIDDLADNLRELLNRVR